ncbi:MULTISPECIES: 4a-hydroxytetrahydrobiopterin dehydratase [Cellulophaga]|jgi:4a-hydroxytetrahydrobiopterin dehydratase|uniref:Putative pterin-4-alpha-carbinolamine dehydratase n=2 Tax=Cellulophaga baltica TaxID=76594 RepID=A0A1G7I471_9FLAO|nr:MULTISPECIES: 4a-hydroxytetrahydrobiopterin dehydratase [Cellulophaga]WFO17424.1 4a-hydroxytetrahydrobiopterin dehydratase [Cellulophaga baltica 4]AIY13793.1 pterin-4-alpha-carbinolamine dehydratase [Cellulophaga baltica NN016038]AIZ42175.1 pterin-4-alpha-carbinolamine dehydratase [Cellulophaga baltica 18]MBA6314858.1 4a-hydroxytetrahydrobiopterin dehydratase [Cellulophaga baltica]MCR1024978.1 4a-hydroxytetrahydrobiopterin dehydratase [Cellulophaga baltica]
MEALNLLEIERILEQLDGWEYVDGAIETSFQFENFKEAFTIMTRIAFECEAQGHHPDWSNVYNSLHIRLNTHDVEGVTEKDFRLARAIESIVDSE